MDPLDPRISRLDALDKGIRLSDPTQLDPRREGQGKAERRPGNRTAIAYAQPVEKFPNLLIRVILTVILTQLAMIGLIMYWIDSNG